MPWGIRFSATENLWPSTLPRQFGLAVSSATFMGLRLSDQDIQYPRWPGQVNPASPAAAGETRGWLAPVPST